MQLDPEILEAVYTNDDQDLRSLCESSVVMLVFLRHFGCTFCREALSDIAKIRPRLKTKGIEVVLVHMSDAETAQVYLDKYKVSDVRNISDPDLSLYEYFGLTKGNFRQLYGLKVWIRGIKAGLLDGHGGPDLNGKFGAVSQMPGIFLLKDCQIQEQFIHKSAADRPDYWQIAQCCV
jgi:peroxiredoxin